VAAARLEDRFLALLQAAGWMAQFRTWATMRDDGLRDYSITNLEPAGDEAPGRALEEIFAEIASDPDRAAARVLRLARSLDGRRAFLAAALQSTIAKADEVHYYKYIAALVEDSALVSEEWQPHLVAAMVYYLKGAGAPESAPVKRAREALRGLGR
jgi:hypothetical protein